MLFLSAIFLILLGASLGSFANMLIVRLKTGESVGGRSHCVSCKKPLKALHLLPVISWCYLRGKCAYCSRSIHWHYPAVEVLMAVFALIAFLRHVPVASPYQWGVIGFEIALSFCLVVIAVMDLRWKLIPMEFTVVSAMVLAAWRVLLGVPWLELIIGAIVISALLAAIVALSRATMMGEGDPVLGLLMGVVLGFPQALLGLLASFIVGGTAALALLMGGCVDRKTQVPFAPFLAIGTLIALWWGGPLEVIFRYALL